ncbi:alanine racemase [Facklamia languida]|uniref:Alanine racemase n=1 Tax=Facklamia languida CCUG 37842 TaxID=883113 RepID=H3NJJ8_9LACT|nr:alanine racemase [Facklamia languida]EHR36811.1 alanine racemase [Facklamia languida CCUG 37842]
MESTLRRTWAEINLDALTYNYQQIKAHIGQDVKFIGVVKADAYGHGSVTVAKHLQDLGVEYLAVSSIDEAIELRVNSITMPILILGHTPKEQVDRLICFNITQAVTCEAKALEYSEEAVKYGGRLKIHLKVDTGMSRLGYLCDGDHFKTGVEGIVNAAQLPGLEAEGIFTHFSMADEEDERAHDYTLEQFNLFMNLVTTVEDRLGWKFPLKHCANTGATVSYPQTHLDMVRPGLLLYGYGPHAKAWGLQPVMAVKTTVSTVKTYSAGTLISYGGTYQTQGDYTRVGVLPYGYADGFSRNLSNRYELMSVQGPVPVLGQICMDMCMVDLTDKLAVDVGSEIEIFGPLNPIERMAELAGTIPYELTCSVSKRVPRIYLEQGQVQHRELLLRM